MTDDKIVEAMREAYDKASVGCVEDWEDRAMRAALSVVRPMIEAAARRAGAEEMRERAASAADAIVQDKNYPAQARIGATFARDAIRALSLEG